MNGRAWLARQMDRAGIRYLQQDNCFPWVADWGQAQRLINTQQEAKWPELLDEDRPPAEPDSRRDLQPFPLRYYWSTYQSEWATDSVFGRAEELRRLYPLLLHHAMITFGNGDVLRFLGKKLAAAGEINGNVTAITKTPSSCTTKPTRPWAACCAQN